MSNTLTIEEVLSEVLKTNRVASVTINIWQGACVPDNDVAIWDGKRHYTAANLHSALGEYRASLRDGVTAEETAEQAIEIIATKAENPTAAQEEADHQNSL